MQRLRFLISLCFFGSILLAGCGGSAAPAAPTSGAGPAKPSVGAKAPASPAPLSPAVKVRVGQIGLIGEAGVDIAFDRGYFKDEGLDVEFVKFNGGAAQTPPLAAGQIDFGSTSPDPGMFNAVAKGIAIKIVAPQATTLPGDKHAAFVVRQDLIDSGKYKGPSDLKDMTIAAGPTLGTTGQLLVEDVLHKGNLTVSDVKLLPLPYQDVVTAMSNKKIDAAWDVEPNISAGVQEHLLKPVITVDEISPGALGEGLLVSPAFAKAQPEAAKRFVTAQLRGQRDYYRAIEKNDGHKADIVKILINHKVVKDAQQFDVLGQTTVEPNGQIDQKALAAYEDYFIKSGGAKSKVAMSDIVDTSYVDYALQRLGKI